MIAYNGKMSLFKDVDKPEEWAELRELYDTARASTFEAKVINAVLTFADDLCEMRNKVMKQLAVLKIAEVPHTAIHPTIWSKTKSAEAYTPTLKRAKGSTDVVSASKKNRKA